MPPKTKVTKDMVVNAAVEVIRKYGYGQVNARTVAEELRCSTQPVMYHFATIDSLKRAAWRRSSMPYRKDSGWIGRKPSACF